MAAPVPHLPQLPHWKPEMTCTSAAQGNTPVLPDTPSLAHIEQVSSGWINKYILTYTLPDGAEKIYESVSRKGLEEYRKVLKAQGTPPHADAVGIFGITPQHEVLLIREYRYPIGDWCVSNPAGLIEPGENPIYAAERELIEETGFGFVRNADGKPIARLLDTPGLSSAGMSDEAVRLMYAYVEPKEAPHREFGELIEPFLLPIDEIGEFLQTCTLPIGTRCQLSLQAFLGNPLEQLAD